MFEQKAVARLHQRLASCWAPRTPAEDTAITEARRIRAAQESNERAFDAMLVCARHRSAAWSAAEREKFAESITAKVEALRQASREKTDQAIAALAARQK